jgi:hypothetical protein
MSYVRTPEHRALRARLIHRWKPWLKSTGPKTPDGKRRSALRGYKGAVRPTLRLIGRVLRQLPPRTAFPLRGSGDG